MVITSPRMEQLLHGQIEPSWLLFEHVLPIITAFEDGKRLPSIDDILGEKKEGREKQLARVITSWINAGMQDLYAAEEAFARYIVPGVPQAVDIHQFRDYANYHDAVVDHLERVKQFNKSLDQITKETIQRIKRQHTPQNGRNLERPIYLALKHGDLHIKQNGENPQIIFQIVRIKDMQRMAAKFARSLCKAVQDYNNLVPALIQFERNLNVHQRFRDAITQVDNPELGERVQETLSAMNAYGMKTPFVTRRSGSKYTERPDFKEYLMIASRVSDILGVINVTRTRMESESIIEKAKEGAFTGAERYKVLHGKRITDNNKRKICGWHYVDDFIVDNHITAQEKVIPDGGMHIFTYLRQQFPNSRRKYRSRVDFGVQALPDFCEDAVGGKGSHLIYETRQQEEVKSLKDDNPTLYKLYHHVYTAALGVLSRVDIKQFELYPTIGTK